MTSLLVPLDPDPSEWLHEGRMQFLKNSLGPSASLLENINLLDNVLNAWLTKEIIFDAVNLFPGMSHDQNISLESFSTSSLNNNFCGNQELSCLLHWCHQRWGHRLESLYLTNQSRLDLVSCRLITVKSDCLAFELYCRLKEHEDTFENLSAKYGVGAERFTGGLFPLQPLDTFPKSMHSMLRDMTPGDLIKPFKYKDSYAIFQLDKWCPSTFNSHTENQLLLWELESWQLAMLPSLKQHLELSSPSSL